MGFPKQEYWSGLPFPSPEDLHDPRIKPVSSAWQADSFTTEPPWKPSQTYTYYANPSPILHMKKIKHRDEIKKRKKGGQGQLLKQGGI